MLNSCGLQLETNFNKEDDAMAEPMEITVARLDERFNGVQKIIVEMAKDQRRLTDSFEELAKSNERLSLVELNTMNTKMGLDKLWEKFENHEKAHINMATHALYDVAKLAVGITLALLFGKYGVHIF
jgi:hypothetical protein